MVFYVSLFDQRSFLPAQFFQLAFKAQPERVFNKRFLIVASL